jgi:hypothetical protein
VIAQAVLLVTAMMAASSAAADGRLTAYISGGIGEEERAQFEASKDYFNLRLVFAARGSGEYLSAVRVRIADDQGIELLEDDSEGPLFYVRLAPGSYVVTARYGDEAQTRRVRLRETGAETLVLYWAEPAADSR